MQATLEGQPLYVELLQEVSPGHSPGAQTVLATFETSAVEFLFPYPQLRPTYTSGVDVDLLMEPTRDFPGIISPKVHIYLAPSHLPWAIPCRVEKLQAITTTQL